MNRILKNLELIRKERGIKQEVIAERLGVSQQSYSGYFTETGDMKISRIQEIADIIGVSLVDVVTYPEKYVPAAEQVTCENCKKNEEIIENLTLLIRELKKKKL